MTYAIAIAPLTLIAVKFIRVSKPFTAGNQYKPEPVTMVESPSIVMLLATIGTHELRTGVCEALGQVSGIRA